MRRPRGAPLGSAGARWDTGVAEQPGMWLQVELPEPATVTEVQIDSAVPAAPRGFGPAPARGAPPAGAPAGGRGGAAPGAPPNGPGAAGRAGGGRGRAGGPPAAGPVAYSLQVSADGTTWGAPLAQGAGATPTTTIAFKPVQTKFIRITQTGTALAGEQWAVQQIRIYRAGQGR